MIWVTIILAILDMIWQWWLSKSKEVPAWLVGATTHWFGVAKEWIATHPRPTSVQRRLVKHVLAMIEEKKEAIERMGSVVAQSVKDFCDAAERTCGEAQVHTLMHARAKEIINA